MLFRSIGGDAVRMLDIASRGFRKRDALYGVMVDRIIGLGALMSLTLLAYLLNQTYCQSKCIALFC